MLQWYAGLIIEQLYLLEASKIKFTRLPVVPPYTAWAQGQLYLTLALSGKVEGAVVEDLGVNTKQSPTLKTEDPTPDPIYMSHNFNW